MAFKADSTTTPTIVVRSGRDPGISDRAKRVFGFGKDASRRERDACRHPTRQPTKVMPSKLTREDAAHGEDAAERYDNGPRGNQPSFSLSALSVLSVAGFDSLALSQQVVGCCDCLPVQLSD